jgi:hypothetical protein
MLIDKLFIGGVWVGSTVRGVKGTGTPVTSAELTGTGEEISDEYTLTVSARAGSTGTVTVNTNSSNNPYEGRVVAGVTFDGVTETFDVIPGVTIVFAGAGANGNTATIYVGDYLGSFDAAGVGAGVPSAGVRHQVENDGATAVVDAIATLLTQAIHVRKTGDVFAYVSPFAPDAVEKTAGGGSDRVMPYELSISATSGVGGAKIATLSVDGVALPANSVQDLETMTLEDGVGLKAVGLANRYRIVLGDLSGLEFAIHEDCADGDDANILIFPSRYVQIAEDVAGVEGTYGIVDVDLTTVGSSTGVIEAADVAYYWVRTLVPASANNESNPYPCNVAIQASESQDAGWTA